MRGRGGYNTRGGYNRNTNTYGNNRMHSSNRSGGRYNDSYGGVSSSGNTRYHGAQNAGESYNRSRDKFNQNSSSFSGNRYESGHKRNYESSRDRSDDRKRPRHDDYRRTSSSNSTRSERPSSSTQVLSSSSHYHRNSTGGGSNSNTNSYRQREDSPGNHHTRSSPMGPPKRMAIRSVTGGNYITHQRGSFSSTRGMRTSIRGVGGSMRIIRTRESTDLKIMRRKLLYAQQKDRARVLKIQKLTSSLRRRRLEKSTSKSPRRSRSCKKLDSSDGEDDTAEKKKKKKDSDTCDKSDSESNKKLPTSKRSTKSVEASEDVCDEEEGENDNIDHKTTLSKVKKVDNSNGDGESDKKKIDSSNGNNDGEKSKDKNSSSKETSDKSGKKKAKDSDEKDKSSKKTSGSKKSKDKDDKKNKKDSDEIRSNKHHSRSSKHHDEEHDNPRKRSFIKLTCIHCHIKCVTFKEYLYHLNSRTHKNALRQVAIRQRADLLRLRARQRTAQREIEENSKEQYESRYCRLCRLAYRQPKAQHQLSDHHKTIKKFLMPYCSSCHMAFKNSMLYEIHRCSLEHIRNKARNQDSDSDNSADEREIDLNKFLTVDSVGEIDIDIMDADVDALLQESEAAQNTDDDEAKKRSLVGANFIKPIEAFYCEICNHYSAKVGDDSLESYTKKHCLQRSHIKAFLRQKEEEDRLNKKSVKKTKCDGEAEKENKSESLEKNDDSENETEDNVKFKATESHENEDGASEIDKNARDAEEKLWEEVDKDLGELLAEVEPLGRDDDEEDESVLNIDIESEKPKPKEAKESKDKEVNGKIEELEFSKKELSVNNTRNSPIKATPSGALPIKQISTTSKAKPQRKAVVAVKKIIKSTSKITQK